MAKSRDEQYREDRTEKIFESWISPNGIHFAGPEAETAYRERTARIKDAIQLKIPDRVPFWFQDSGFFPCKYTGMTCEEAMYHPETRH